MDITNLVHSLKVTQTYFVILTSQRALLRHIHLHPVSGVDEISGKQWQLVIMEVLVSDSQEVMSGLIPCARRSLGWAGLGFICILYKKLYIFLSYVVVLTSLH